MSANEGKLDVTSMYISIDDLEKSGEYCLHQAAFPSFRLITVVIAPHLSVISMHMHAEEAAQKRSVSLHGIPVFMGMGNECFSEFTLADNTRGTRGHSRKLIKFRCTRDCCKYFFFKHSD